MQRHPRTNCCPSATTDFGSCEPERACPDSSPSSNSGAGSDNGAGNGGGNNGARADDGSRAIRRK